MNLNDTDIVKKPLLTEKFDVQREEHNIYAFEVDRRANKIQVRSAIERLFSVKVEDVRTNVMRGKPKRMGRVVGQRSSWKKAIVRLRKGDSIELVDGGVPAEG